MDSPFKGWQQLSPNVLLNQQGNSYSFQSICNNLDSCRIYLMTICCCNPFLGPHIKKIQKNSKKYIITKYNSEKMPERPKNTQKLIEDVKKYKNYFLTVYH